ncbi:MAG: lipopolysaccharide biosynthesis protein, partial [Steroidobacteraceae bacterium]
LIEPPQPPEKPISPNRILIVVLGLLMAVSLGFGAVVARESLDASVRGPTDIRQLLQVPALASIPIIVTATDRARHQRMLRYSWGGGVVVATLAVLSVHFFVLPLDVLWVSLWRRFGM